MASTRLYLDCRHPRSDGSCPLKIAISHKSTTRLVHLEIYIHPEEWDSRAQRVVSRPDKAFINTTLWKRKQEVDVVLLRLTEGGKLRGLSCAQLRDAILSELEPDPLASPAPVSFAQHLIAFADQHHGRTRDLYLATLRHLEKFAGSALASLRFEDISKAWLLQFDRYLARTSPSQNARNIHLRNLRAVFNDALDAELTTCYPFRRFSIKPVETPKRSLSAEQLRLLFSCPCEKWQKRYVDMFQLMFFLCGINVVDLFSLGEMVDGRVEYYRRKTGKFFSVKVEPEALAIIEAYRGRSALLEMADRCSNYRAFAMRQNIALQRVGSPGDPLFPHLTSYWARHSWATLAAELDIPDDTISRALGHSLTSGARVTQVYINFNRRKIDEANRRVMDYVLYGKV